MGLCVRVIRYTTDLAAHELGHLSVVAVEHILQAQPESRGETAFNIFVQRDTV